MSKLSSKERPNKYDEKVKIEGSFEEIIERTAKQARKKAEEKKAKKSAGRK